MTDDTDYFKTREFQKILKRYEESVRSGQSTYMDADDLADIADYYQYQGQPDEAEEAINLALRINSEALGPLLYKARQALSRNNYETAWDYAEHIKALDEAEYMYLYGEILICEGKTEDADQWFRQNYKETPPDELMDYVYDVAHLFAEYDQYEKAFEWVARSQGDDSDDFKELMARTLYGLGKYEDSSRLFNELIDQHPYSKDYWNALASAQYMNEDYGASVTSSEYAIAIDPHDPDSFLAKAHALYCLENYEEALNYFKRYSEMRSNDELGFLHQGTCLINLGRYDEAIACLEEAKDLAADDSPYLAEIYQELAFSYSEKQLPETALYILDKTKDLDCDHINMEVIRGHILLSNKRIDEAEQAFKEAIRMSGNAPKTMLRVMVSLYDNGMIKTAYSFFKAFFSQIDSEWKEGYAYMAICCWDLHYTEEFLKYLSIAVEKNPKESRRVLAQLFPDGMDPSEYINYIKDKLKTK
jgi:tetratricopeptide (TPR) repeat protein